MSTLDALPGADADSSPGVCASPLDAIPPAAVQLSFPSVSLGQAAIEPLFNPIEASSLGLRSSSGRSLLFAESTDEAEGFNHPEDPRGQSSDLVSSDEARHLYRLHGRLGQGHFGEVWRGAQSSGPPSSSGHQDGASDATAAAGQFVLKRLMVERGEEVRLSGLREAYFGELLKRKQAAADAGVFEGKGNPAQALEEMAGLQHIVSWATGLGDILFALVLASSVQLAASCVCVSPLGFIEL